MEKKPLNIVLLLLLIAALVVMAASGAFVVAYKWAKAKFSKGGATAPATPTTPEAAAST